MCGSAQKGGINADTIAPSLSRCGFIDPVVRGNVPREGEEEEEEEGEREEDKEREKERGRAGIQSAIFAAGVFTYPPCNLNKKRSLCGIVTLKTTRVDG